MEICRICNSAPGLAFDTPICTDCDTLGFRYCPFCNCIGFDPNPADGIWIAPARCHNADH